MSGWSFGLDLAGYSSGRSILAAARLRNQHIDVVILDTPVLSRPIKGEADTAFVQEAEADLLGACLRLGALAVDVPIDLQNLRQPVLQGRVWELTRRPVDRAFGGLAPLADRIGSTVARFAAIHARLEGAAEIGINLFETYPAASLKLMGQTGKGYKPGLCHLEENRWRGCGIKDTSDAAMAVILERLRISADDPISDDDLDAAICAITLAVEATSRLEGQALADFIAQSLGSGHAAASGYILLKAIPGVSIRITRAEAGEWFKGHSATI